MFFIMLCISVLCLLYYGLILAYSGYGTTFSRFWLFAGLAGAVFSMGLRFGIYNKIWMNRGAVLLLLGITATGIFIFLGIEGILVYYSRQKSLPGTDYILVLGAQVKGKVISRTLLRRLDTAVLYMRENIKTIAIVSGGVNEKGSLSEAEAMRQYLVKQGIDNRRIIKEEKSRNTFENIRYCKPMLKENATVAIVTNGFHIFRSLRIAKKQGLSRVKGIAAPTDRILCVNYYVREAAGVMKDLLLGNL